MSNTKVRMPSTMEELEQKTLQHALRGDGDPESLAMAQMHIAKKLMEVEETQIFAIEAMAGWFPPLAQAVQFSPGLRWAGTVSKRWQRFFTRIYPRYQEFAIYSYNEIAGKEYEHLFPNLELSARVWEFMGDVFPMIREAVVAKFYEMLMELKREIELDTKSKERMTFLGVLNPQEGQPEGKTSMRMQRQLEKAQYED